MVIRKSHETPTTVPERPTTRTIAYTIVMTGSPQPVKENIEELTNLTRSECVDRVSRSSPWKTNGESTRGVQALVRVVLGREAHSPKRAMSPRLPSLATEVPMATFDPPESGEDRPGAQSVT